MNQPSEWTPYNAEHLRMPRTKRNTRRLVIAVAIFYAILTGVLWYQTAHGIPLTPMWTVIVPIADWNEARRDDLIAICNEHNGWHAYTEQPIIGQVTFDCLRKPGAWRDST